MPIHHPQLQLFRAQITDDILIVGDEKTKDGLRGAIFGHIFANGGTEGRRGEGEERREGASERGRGVVEVGEEVVEHFFGSGEEVSEVEGGFVIVYLEDRRGEKEEDLVVEEGKLVEKEGGGFLGVGEDDEVPGRFVEEDKFHFTCLFFVFCFVFVFVFVVFVFVCLF